MELTLTQEFLLLILWRMKCTSRFRYVKSKKVVIQFFTELDNYVCDSYFTVVQELYDLARTRKFEVPLVDGLGNIGDTSDPEYMEGANPKYTEVALSEAGVEYILAHGYDKITCYELMSKLDIFFT